MFDYNNILNGVSIPQIDNFGDDVIIRVRTEASGSDSWDPEFVTVDTTVRAVRTKFKKMEIDGTIIQRDDVLFLIAPDPDYPDPELVDRLVDGSDTYEVLHVETVKPGPLAVLWKVHCRK